MILADNKLYGTGLNSSGQLGLQGYKDDQQTIKNIHQINKITQIRTSLNEKTK